MPKVLMGVGVAVALLAFVTYMAMHANPVTCEVCMEYEGRRACATSSAKDETQARLAAASSACSRITGGVTSTIRCSHIDPVSVSCEE